MVAQTQLTTLGVSIRGSTMLFIACKVWPMLLRHQSYWHVQSTLTGPAISLLTCGCIRYVNGGNSSCYKVEKGIEVLFPSTARQGRGPKLFQLFRLVARLTKLPGDCREVKLIATTTGRNRSWVLT